MPTAWECFRGERLGFEADLSLMSAVIPFMSPVPFLRLLVTLPEDDGTPTSVNCSSFKPAFGVKATLFWSNDCGDEVGSLLAGGSCLELVRRLGFGLSGGISASGSWLYFANMPRSSGSKGSGISDKEISGSSLTDSDDPTFLLALDPVLAVFAAFRLEGFGVIESFALGIGVKSGVGKVGT